MLKVIKNIMTPDEIKSEEKMTVSMKKLKSERDEIIRNIISGADERKLIIVGPCSADNEDSVCDYVARLGKLQGKVSDKLFIVPRIYTNKPRTRGEGYKGILHNPDPHSEVTDIQSGILRLRKMHLRAINESGLTGADEMLYPENFMYMDDILSYHTIGARSSENQQHRLVASGIDVPVGIKNPMNGSISVVLNSVYASQIPNEFLYRTAQVKTSGNPYAHVVLRGSVSVHGHNVPNYHYEDLLNLSEMYEKEKLANPAVIVDTNHSNSAKRYLEQVRIAQEIFTNTKRNTCINKLVKGLMVESYIEDGNQPMSGTVYGKSFTDSCLGWEKTERLILDLADMV